MSRSLPERQLALIAWADLRSGEGFAERVGEDLRLLLLVDDDSADGAYERLENSVESQGRLFECAPAAVSVIVAAVAAGVIPPPNLASSLDVLGRIVAGTSDESEIALGLGDLRARCHDEARRGYWALMRVACEQHPFSASEVAAAVLAVLDRDHANSLLR